MSRFWCCECGAVATPSCEVAHMVMAKEAALQRALNAVQGSEVTMALNDLLSGTKSIIVDEEQVSAALSLLMSTEPWSVTLQRGAGPSFRVSVPAAPVNETSPVECLLAALVQVFAANGSLAADPWTQASAAPPSEWAQGGNRAQQSIRVRHCFPSFREGPNSTDQRTLTNTEFGADDDEIRVVEDDFKPQLKSTEHQSVPSPAKEPQPHVETVTCTVDQGPPEPRHTSTPVAVGCVAPGASGSPATDKSRRLRLVNVSTCSSSPEDKQHLIDIVKQRGVLRITKLPCAADPKWSLKLLKAASPWVEDLELYEVELSHVEVALASPALEKLKLSWTAEADVCFLPLRKLRLKSGAKGIKTMHMPVNLPLESLRNILKMHNETLEQLYLAMSHLELPAVKALTHNLALLKPTLPKLSRFMMVRGEDAVHDPAYCSEVLNMLRRVLPDSCHVGCKKCETLPQSTQQLQPAYSRFDLAAGAATSNILRSESSIPPSNYHAHNHGRTRNTGSSGPSRKRKRPNHHQRY